jgi:hypothetical protein
LNDSQKGNRKNSRSATLLIIKKWESKVVQDYYVFGTPTMYLLDRNQKILLRPNAVVQMDAWIDWYLVQGNLLSE